MDFTISNQIFCYIFLSFIQIKCNCLSMLNSEFLSFIALDFCVSITVVHVRDYHRHKVANQK